MTIYVIGYDLHPKAGETYDELIEAIKKIGDWWHCLDFDMASRIESYLRPDQGQVVAAHEG